MFVSRATLPLLLALAACNTTPPPPADANAQASSEPVAQAQQDQKAEPAPAPANSTELTADEIALIEADPKTLTPEQNRKRAYALRKQIMQNPNSEAAKTLEEARQAAMAGEIDPKAKEKPADNGVVIPAPEYLKNPDQSYGKPDIEQP